MPRQTEFLRAALLNRWLAVVAAWCTLSSFAALPCGASDEKPPVPWWQAETVMGEDSTLVLTNRPWWDRAKALACGEHLLLKSELPGGGQMLVRCERLKRPREQDAILWVIDDDGDLSRATPTVTRTTTATWSTTIATAKSTGCSTTWTTTTTKRPTRWKCDTSRAGSCAWHGSAST